MMVRATQVSTRQVSTVVWLLFFTKIEMKHLQTTKHLMIMDRSPCEVPETKVESLLVPQ